MMEKQRIFIVLTLLTGVLQGVVMAAGRAGGPQIPPRITEEPTNVTVLRNEPATLRCAFDGQPTPEVSWYRDGEALEPRGHRLVLPDGSLFFLRVTQGRGGRNNGDAGTYWCVARNSAGSARSKNATLTVAYLQPDFRRLPESTRTVVGEPVRLHCQGPKGQPEPEITWRKNGVPIAWDDELALDKERILVEESGDLVIRHVLLSDEGKYQCVAHNMAATRESPAVSLSAYVRPQVSIPQPDLVVVLGEEASFECHASGDPAVRLVWRRLLDEGGVGSSGSDTPLDAKLDDNRSSFKIDKVALSDAGRYVCEAENDVGKASSTAVLTVLIPPNWTAIPPTELKAEAGQPLSVNCSVSGTPSPLVFWRREVTGHNQTSWNLSSTSNGTLIIQNVQPEDAGPMYCAAVNAGGALLARVNLEVTRSIHSVPPHFSVGPANQTLPIRSPALLQCQALNTTDAISWTRNGHPIIINHNTSSGIKILPSGSLQIEHLQLEDSGTYTCWAGRSAGWTANLLVENPINPNVAFNRAPSDPLALPGPPSQPVVTNQTAHSVTITWQSSSRMGASPLIGYTVEIYSPDGPLVTGTWTWSGNPGENETNSSWFVMTRRLKANSFTIDGLKAGSWFLCLIRAENSHGLSLPSPVSSWIHSVHHLVTDPDVVQTRELLSGSLLQLDRIQPLSPTSVQLHWDIVDGESYIEGLYVFHFDSFDSAKSLSSSHVVKDPGSMTYTVSQLRPDTNYTFFLVPFYGAVEGRPSNSRFIRTNPDAPSGFPQNMTVRQFNESSVLLQWFEPPLHQQNGAITAYQIFVYSAETNQLLANLTLPSSSNSIAVGGLEGGTRYAFRAAAWTQVGLGPSSPPVTLAVEMNHSTSTVPMTDQEVHSFPSNVAQETWMIMLVGGTLLVLLLTTILGVIIRRRKVCQHSGSRSSRPSSRGNQSHLLWPLPSQPWTNNTGTVDPSKDVHPQLGPDYAEVFHHANPAGMSSFVAQPAAAYASTTLIRNTTASLPFRYQQNGTGRSVPQLGDPGSIGGLQQQQQQQQHSMGGLNRNSSQPLVPNWLELLPPPPQHPPPPLMVSPDRGVGKNDGYPSFMTTLTLPSTIQGCHPSAGGIQHYPFRSTFNNAQSQPTLLPQHVRNSYVQAQHQSQNRHSSGRYPSSDMMVPAQQEEGLYATCTYDHIEPYPLSSYR